MSGRITSKKIALGDGWYYAEAFKPKTHSLMVLRYYLEHECPGYPPRGGTLDFAGMMCSVCGDKTKKEVLEKGMTLLAMRVAG